MTPLTIETDVSPEGLIQIQIPDELRGQKVKVTVEGIDAASDNPHSPGLDVGLDKLRKDYEARRITQQEFSEAYVELLERHNSRDPNAASKVRVFGRWKGQIRVMPDFDDPIEGLEWAYP